MSIVSSAYECNGYCLVKNAIEIDKVSSIVDDLKIFENELNNFGIRDLMNKIPSIRDLAMSPVLLDLSKNILGELSKPVRAVFFDKNPDSNWNVAWHQDTSIAVKRKVDVQGFGPWSEKQGVVHVEPPENYLANMLTLRIHLDHANSETGVLRVLPGTHKMGRLKSNEILAIVEKSENNIVECEANPGDVLLMNPLLFHSSRKAVKPSHRRIIHIEYSAMTLPQSLEWYECG